MYLTTKRTVVTEECYHVRGCHLKPEQLEAGIKSGEFNIIEVRAIESIMWVVNKSGRRIAVLEKDGGSSGDNTEIEVLPPRNGIEPWVEAGCKAVVLS